MSGTNKRIAQRFPTSWRAMVRPETEAGAFYAAVVTDISSTGFSLITERGFDEGTRLVFKIYPPLLELESVTREMMLMVGVVWRRTQDRQGKHQYGVRIEEFFAGKRDYELYLQSYESAKEP
jgi:hypothetical protein